jgi:hypothetical protein
VLRVLVLAAAVVAAPLPALAGEVTGTAAQPPVLQTAIAKVAVSEVQALSTPPSTVRAQEAPAVDREATLGSGSYFKSPAGIITLIAVGVGVGVALYSTSNDRIKSPAK